MADLCAEHYSWTATGDESNPDAATVQERAVAFLSRLDTLFMEGNILAMPQTFTGVTLMFLRGTSRYTCCNSVQIVDQAPSSKLLCTWLQQHGRSAPDEAHGPLSSATRGFKRVLLVHERFQGPTGERRPKAARRDKGIERDLPHSRRADRFWRCRQDPCCIYRSFLQNAR